MKIKTRILAAIALAAPLFTGQAHAAGGLISIIVNDPANPYWTTEGNLASAEAKKLGYTSNVSASRGDTNTESQLVDTAITNKSVAIVLDPANSTGSIGAVKKAVAAKIPVFLVNAEINQLGLATAQLVSNNAQGAALVAQQWAKDMGGKGRYLELLGNPADNNAATRSNGFKSVLSQYPDLKKIGEQVANWQRTQGFSATQTLLQAHPEANGLISGADEMTLGAIAALKQAGKLKDVKIGSFDGAPGAIEAIKAGELDVTVLQPVAEFSVRAVQEADQFIRTGKTGAASEKQLFDCTLITKANVSKYTAPFVLSK